MFRFYFLILTHLHWGFFIYLLMKKSRKNMDTMSTEERWNNCRKSISIIVKHSKCPLTVYGEENLPKEGGYIMMPNHQGRWDGIIMTHSHKRPMSFVIDDKRSHMVVERDFIDASESIRLDRSNGRAAFKGLKEMTDRVAEGKRFCLFPEGGYDHNGNTMRDFSPSCFHFLLQKPSPIVPVCIKDSYRVFNYEHFSDFFRHIPVEVHFLKPIYPEEYKGMTKGELSDLVKSRIQAKLDEIV